MPSSAPTVMVSSTFYDLSQVRADLAQFIEDELGYRPLLSEYASFPIDPDVDTIENCRRRVERDADILVLVVGGRYGYVDSATDKSVTNLEYLTARAKGIPIYTFVHRDVTNILPVWKNNPESDFSAKVDDVRLFEFVEQIRSQDRVWTQDFERAQDIVARLRIQFAHLMQEGLKWQKRVSGESMVSLSGLRGKALRLALERPEAWEYRFFGQVLRDEVEANLDLRREHRLGIVMGAGEYISQDEILRWIRTQTNELTNLAESLNNLINVALPEALRPSGMPGDVPEMKFVAQRLGAGYRHAIEWSQRVRRLHVEDEHKQLLKEMSLWTNNMIEGIENYGPSFLRQIDEALLNHSGEEPTVIEARLVLEVSNMDRYNEELYRVFGDPD